MIWGSGNPKLLKMCVFGLKNFFRRKLTKGVLNVQKKTGEETSPNLGKMVEDTLSVPATMYVSFSTDPEDLCIGSSQNV